MVRLDDDGFGWVSSITPPAPSGGLFGGIGAAIGGAVGNFGTPSGGGQSVWDWTGGGMDVPYGDLTTDWTMQPGFEGGDVYSPPSPAYWEQSPTDNPWQRQREDPFSLSFDYSSPLATGGDWVQGGEWQGPISPQQRFEMSNPSAPVFDMGEFSNIDPNTKQAWPSAAERYQAGLADYQDAQSNPWYERAWEGVTGYLTDDPKNTDRGGFLDTAFGAGEANRQRIFPGSDEWNPVARELTQALVDPWSYTGFAAAPALGNMGRGGAIAAEMLAPSFTGGGAAASIAGEIAVNAAANYGGRLAAEEAAERTDNPWLIGAAGLLGGVVGGVGAYGGVKSLDTGIRAIDVPTVRAALDEEFGAVNPRPDRMGPLVKGDVVQDVSGKTWTVAKDSEGTARSFVKLTDGAGETKTIRRTMLIPESQATPVPNTAQILADTEIDEGTFDTARQKILAAVKQENDLRRSGLVDWEIHQGRVGQVGGIKSNIDDGLAANLSADDIAMRARAAARVGPLRQTFAQPINLTPNEIEAVKAFTIGRIHAETTSPYDLFHIAGDDSALAKLVAGAGLQPKEIEWVRATLGDEIADLAARRSPDNLTKAGEAALAAKNRAAEEALRAKAAKQAQADLARANKLAVAAGEKADKAAAKAHWQAVKSLNAVAQKDIDDLLNPLRTTAEQRAIGLARLQQLHEQAQRLAGDKASVALGFKRMSPGERQAAELAKQVAKEQKGSLTNTTQVKLLKQADGVLAKFEGDTALKSQVKQSMNYWLQGNRAILANIRESRDNIVAQVARTVDSVRTGDVADSYLVSLLQRKANLEGTLKLQGLNEEQAKQIGDALQNYELKGRYPQGVPQHIQDMLADARKPAGKVAESLATLSQEMKNTMFGVDIGVGGQQGLKAGALAWPQLVAGSVNRFLALAHLPHLNTVAEDIMLPRKIASSMDGVAHGARTGLTDLTHEGTLLRHAGAPGRLLDRPVSYAIAKLTDFQFDTVLGNVRQLIYEGNLVLAHVTRNDISNPVVRRQAADAANLVTSVGKLATKRSRATQEKAFLLSPTMTRALLQQIGLVGRTLNPLSGATPYERMLGATAVVGAVTSVLAVGKLVNDYIGIGEFEFDPSQPGFGNITLPNGYVINLFPQEQVIKSFLQAGRYLAEGEQGDAKRVSINLGLGRVSPLLGVGAKAAGFGYDSEQGKWAHGDWGNTMSNQQRILNLSPLPTTVLSWMNGAEPFELALEFAGQNTFKENEIATLNRIAPNGNWFALSADERASIIADNPEAKLLQESYDKRRFELADKQIPADAENTIAWHEYNTYMREKEGEFDIAAQRYWDAMGAATDDKGRRQAGADLRANVAAIEGKYGAMIDALDHRNRTVTGESMFSGKKVPTAVDDAVSAYYDTFKEFSKGGTLDYDKQQMAVRALEEEWKKDPALFEAVQERINVTKDYDNRLIDNLKAEQKIIRDSGYWEAENKTAFRANHPEIAELVKKYGYSPVSVGIEDITIDFKGRQERLDAKFESGGITAKEWREQMREFSESKRDQIEGLLSQFPDMKPDDLKPGTPVDRYFAEIDARKDPDSKKLTSAEWDEVERWYSQQTPEDKATIDNALGVNSTPLQKKYHQDMEKIEATGYWKVDEHYWKSFAEYYKVPADWTQERFEKYALDSYSKSAAEFLDRTKPNWRVTNPSLALNMAQNAVDQVMSPLQQAVTEGRAYLRQYYPEEAELIRFWGYGGTGQAELRYVATH